MYISLFTQNLRYHLPLVGQLLKSWPDREVSLVLDRTDLGQERSILLLALAFEHRAIPLTWRVLPFGGTGAEVQLGCEHAERSRPACRPDPPGMFAPPRRRFD